MGGAPGCRKVGGEEAVGTREEVLAGRMLDDFDEGARPSLEGVRLVSDVEVVEEDELLSELMDEEGAVHEAGPDWTVAKTNPAGFMEVVAVGSDLS